MVSDSVTVTVKLLSSVDGADTGGEGTGEGVLCLGDIGRDFSDEAAEIKLLGSSSTATVITLK